MHWDLFFITTIDFRMTVAGFRVLDWMRTVHMLMYSTKWCLVMQFSKE